MAEYWKSTPKYWCKHCSTYVKDTPFERKQHENTGKHQGNLKRFLREIQNDHERGEREKSKAKAEIERLNRVVGTASTQRSTSAAGIPPNSSTASKPNALSAADQKRQWAQLVELGIKVPESARADMAMASEWETVAKEAVESEPKSDETHSVGVRKRKFEGQEEEENAIDVAAKRGWGTTMKKHPGADDDLDDLLAVKIKIKTDSLAENDIENTPHQSTPDLTNVATLENANFEGHDSSQKLTNVEPSGSFPGTAGETSEIKAENEELKPKLTDVGEGESPPPVFKKRKAKHVAVKKDFG